MASVFANLGVKITADIKDFEKGIQKAFNSTKSLNTMMGDVGKKMTMGLTVPLVGLGTVASKTFMEFDTSVRKVGTLLSGTGKTMDDVKKEARSMSSEFAVSQTEITEAMYEAISAGVTATETQDFLTVALKSSKGGFTDTTTAVNGLTNILNSYNMETSEAEKVANQMLIAQNKGKTTFGEMASTMAGVTPVANQLKIKTEELFSAVAVLTANGIGTSEAVTGLNMALSNVIKPSAEATKVAEALGIEFSSTAVQSKGLVPFLNEIKDKLKQSAPEYAKCIDDLGKTSSRMLELEKAGQKGSAEYKNLAKSQKELQAQSELLAKASESEINGFAQLFGSVNGLNSVMVLTSEGGGQLFNETMEEMGTNASALDEAYSTMSEGSAVTFQQAMIDMKNALTDVGEALAPFVAKIGQFVSMVAKGFSNLPAPIKSFIVTFLGILALVGPLLLFTSKVVSSVGTISKAFKVLKKVGSIGKVVKKVGGIFTTGIGKITKLFTGAVGLIGKACMFLFTTPFGWVILGIMLLVGVIYILWKNWDVVGKYVVAIWEWIKETIGAILEGIWNVVKFIVGMVVAYFKFQFELMLTIVQMVMSAIMGVIEGILSFILAIIQAGVDLIKACWEFVWGLICAYAQYVWDVISTVIQAGVDFVKLIIQTAFDYIKLIIQTVWDTICLIFTTVWNLIVGIFTGNTDLIKETIQGFKDGLFAIFNRLWEGICDIVSKLWNGVKDIFNNFIGGIVEAVTKFKNKFVDIFTNLKENVLGVFRGLGKGIQGLINGILKGVNGMINALNKLSFDVPDWVPLIGGESFGFNIPNIPQVSWFDKGGIFNSPQIIGVGEKRPEFVGALDDLKSLMRDVLREEGANNGSNGVALKIENFYNEREQDIEQLVEEIEFYRRRKRY